MILVILTKIKYLRMNQLTKFVSKKGTIGIRMNWGQAFVRAGLFLITERNGM